jgi:hypothetical protein
MKKISTFYSMSFSLLITAFIAGCGDEETANAGKSHAEVLRNVVATAGEKLEAGLEANDIQAAVSEIVQTLDEYEPRSCFKPYLSLYRNLEILESRAKNSTDAELKGMVNYLKNQATEILASTGA